MVASKLSQILQLNPSSEIVFQGPFEHVVTSYLELKNPSDNRVGFKVKTTAPRRYCVRPNSGIVEPGGKVRIAIMLQPLESESDAERSKHKFMVQSTVIQNPGTVNIDEIWQNALPDEVMDSKLRCVFHTPDQTAANEDQANDTKQRQQQQQINQITKQTSSSTNSTTSQQQASRQQQSNVPSGERANISSEQITTSTPVPATSRVTSSTSQAWLSGDQKRSDAFESRPADKSLASSHNLTNSFLQPMSDDYKIVLVSLAMLFLGVILGKYII